MLLDAGQLGSSDKVYDVAIVGGGAAGLSLARELSGAGLSIIVLEAGGYKRTKASQEFYRGEVVDPKVHPWIDSYRVRAIGGSSRIWGGRTIPFDPIDFVARDWVPGSGWPFGFDELEPYYRRAVPETEAGRPAFLPSDALPGSQRELAPGLDGELFETTVERFSKPTNFWRLHGDALRAATDVHVVREAPVTGIRLTADGHSVAQLDVAVPEGRTLAVKARRYVLALGGLETTRLLLASNDVRPNGVGNDADQLGRNYMSHLCTTAGTVTFSSPPDAIAYDYERDELGIYVRRRLALTHLAQMRFGLLNTTFRTHLPEPANPAHGDAILSAMFLVKNLVLYEYARKFQEGRVTQAERLGHLRNILSQPLRLTRFGINWLRRRTLADRKLPSVVLGSSLNTYVLEFHAEQAPNPDSRLTLSDERDALGVPRLKVDWRITDLDIASLKRSYALLRDELARTGTGKLVYDPDDLEDRTRRHGVVGGHHIGTARMSVDPAKGVVDPDLRVHGISDLYVASSAVFPTSGQANPTLTIVALTLRLAGHLKAELRAPSLEPAAAQPVP